MAETETVLAPIAEEGPCSQALPYHGTANDEKAPSSYRHDYEHRDNKLRGPEIEHGVS
jgi:hypothetical protein